jgi:hypothetical protein
MTPQCGSAKCRRGSTQLAVRRKVAPPVKVPEGCLGTKRRRISEATENVMP